MKRSLFVIDTESYAGDFSRELTAYITGQIGEDQAGQSEQQVYRSNSSNPDLTDLILQVNDDGELYSPSSLYSTVGWYSDGIGKNSRDIAENETRDLEAHIQSSSKNWADLLKPIQDRLDQKNFTALWSEQTCLTQKKMYEQMLAKVRSSTSLIKYPAYMSVAIYFKDELTEDILVNLKKLAQEYAQSNNIQITGFRVIEESVTPESVEDTPQD